VIERNVSRVQRIMDLTPNQQDGHEDGHKGIDPWGTPNQIECNQQQGACIFLGTSRRRARQTTSAGSAEIADGLSELDVSGGSFVVALNMGLMPHTWLVLRSRLPHQRGEIRFANAPALTAGELRSRRTVQRLDGSLTVGAAVLGSVSLTPDGT